MKDSIVNKNEKVNASGGIILLGFLTVLNTLNFVDRQLLSSFANYIVPELQLSNTQFAILTGPAFILFYAVAGLVMGFVADVVNRAKLIAFAVGLWSLLTGVTGMATSFLGLLLPRMFIGVGEAALTPASLAMLGDRFPSHRLGLLSGIYYAGVPLGAGASLLLAGFGGQHLGWRMCFIGLGVLGMSLSIAAYFFRDVRSSPQVVQRSDLRSISKVFLRVVVKSRRLQYVLLAGVLLHMLIGVTVFDQLWLVKERGFDRSTIAIIAGVIFCTAGLAGNIFGGVVSDVWHRRTGKSRLVLFVWTLMLAGPFVVAVRIVEPTSPIFWVGVVATSFQLGAMYGPLFSTIQELSPANAKATTLAFSIFIQNVLGIGVCVVASGVALDYLTKIGVAQPYTTVSLTVAIISLGAIPLLWLAIRRPEKPVLDAS